MPLPRIFHARASYRFAHPLCMAVSSSLPSAPPSPFACVPHHSIAKEELECKAIADDAEADLAIALPALNAALEEVDKLDKSSIRWVD